MAILTKVTAGTGVTSKGSTLTPVEADNNTIEIVAQIAAKEASINASTAKTIPLDADLIGVIDTAASNIIKKTTFTQIKAFLKTYFDSLYAVLIAPAFTGDATLDGFVIGYKGVPQNIQSGNYTLALTDKGKHIYSANAGAQTLIIPTSAAVAFTVGDAITIINNGTTAISFTTTSLTVYKAGTSTVWATGGTLAIRGMATLVNVATDTWFISGVGLS